MDREEVIRMAIECGLGVEMKDCGYEGDVLWFDADPMPFAAMVAAAKQEQCAKACESFGQTLANGQMLAEAIRALP